MPDGPAVERGLRFAVEEGQVLAFARAVGESLPGLGDEVPPTFAATSVFYDPDHMRDMRPAGVLAAATNPSGALLHAEQHFEYLAPVHVGDVLRVIERRGRTWSKLSRSGGTLTFSEIVKELHDDNGMVVVRSTMVLVATETPAEPS